MGTRAFLTQAPSPLLTKLKKLAPGDFREWFRLPERRHRTPLRRVSVVIPAHNEENYLRRTLTSLRRQNYDWFETIVVANGCTDATAEVARDLCDRLIVLSQKSLGVARNLGARMARGELLVFLDADTTLEPMTLRRISEEFTPGCAACTIRGQPDRRESKYILIYGLKNFVHRTALHRGSSGVIVCWKEHFIKAGGFDEALEVRENSELIRRLMRFGAYRYIGDVSAATSMRRYDKCGIRRLAWLWLKLWIQSLVGDLHRRHYETVR